MKLMGNNNSDKMAEEIIRLMKADKSVDAPQDALDWSKNIFRARAAATAAEPKKTFAQKIFARLQADLSPKEALFGERSSSAGQARQMLFEAGENSIDLRIKQAEKGLEIYGQILGAGFAGGRVTLGDFETTANELSEFKFIEIPAGKYVLRLRAGEREVVIENLDLL